MTNLRAIEFWSGTLPSGETVTLHTGNERVFDTADAQWLLAEYPERFVQVEGIDPAPVLSADNETVTAATDEPASAPQPKANAVRSSKKS